MMTIKIIKRALHLLRVNPKLFLKRIFLGIRALQPLFRNSIYKNINGVKFKFDFNFSPYVKRIYFGTYEIGTIEVIKKFLKEGDSFIDIGAHIGYFTALAAGCVGKGGQVHSFEPVPEYFRKLRELAQINPQYKIIVNRFALGEKEGRVKIYISNRNVRNNTIVPHLIDETSLKKIIEVPVHRLDDYIQEKKLENIKLIKIDVEGYEFPVLKGLEKYFLKCHKTNSCPPVLCEIQPKAYPWLGCKLKDLFDYMRKFSYYPFEVVAPQKKLRESDILREQDVLFKSCKFEGNI